MKIRTHFIDNISSVSEFKIGDIVCSFSAYGITIAKVTKIDSVGCFLTLQNGEQKYHNTSFMVWKIASKQHIKEALVLAKKHIEATSKKQRKSYERLSNSIHNLEKWYKEFNQQDTQMVFSPDDIIVHVGSFGVDFEYYKVLKKKNNNYIVSMWEKSYLDNNEKEINPVYYRLIRKSELDNSIRQFPDFIKQQREWLKYYKKENNIYKIKELEERLKQFEAKLKSFKKWIKNMKNN